MAVLGERNWYLPRWLGWLPPVGLENPALPEQDPVREPVLRES
jgi:RND superfamily putative drug exporter